MLNYTHTHTYTSIVEVIRSMANPFEYVQTYTFNLIAYKPYSLVFKPYTRIIKQNKKKKR